MDHFAVGEGAGRLLAQKVELVEMAQVEPLGYALPYEALWRGGWRQLVDAKEGVAPAGDVLHEGDAQFVERDLPRMDTTKPPIPQMILRTGLKNTPRPMTPTTSDAIENTIFIMLKIVIVLNSATL